MTARPDLAATLEEGGRFRDDQLHETTDVIRSGEYKWIIQRDDHEKISSLEMSRKNLILCSWEDANRDGSMDAVTVFSDDGRRRETFADDDGDGTLDQVTDGVQRGYANELTTSWSVSCAGALCTFTFQQEGVQKAVRQR